MSSFARLSAALGTAAVLATAGLGFAYSDTTPPPITYDLKSSSQQAAPSTPVPAQPTPQPTPLGDFQAAFTSIFPTLGGTDHTDPSAGLWPGIQTPPNVAALGRHLVRVYATPEVIENGSELTLSAACPSGGLVTVDPGVRSALPYIARVTNVNVWSSPANGDVGQSSLGVHFTNNSSNNELAAFQFVCSVRD